MGQLKQAEKGKTPFSAKDFNGLDADTLPVKK
jgi:hypothetical protein